MIGSNLWLWHLAQPMVSPMKTCIVVSTLSLIAATRNSSSSVPPSVLVIVLRWNAVAIFCSRLAPWSRSPADLPENELIERQVAVERTDDPVAIPPDGGPKRIGTKTRRVGIPGQVEPHPRPPLAEGRVGEKAVNHSLVRIPEESATNRLISSGVGGRPRRSRLKRRKSTGRSASGDGFSPSFRRRSRIHASMPFRGHAPDATRGIGLACGLINAQ